MADTSDDPVELLARHMHRQHAKTPFGQGEIWADIGQERRSYWRQMARATFDALGMQRRPWLRLIGRSG